jgi:hypothetical protein
MTRWIPEQISAETRQVLSKSGKIKGSRDGTVSVHEIDCQRNSL